MGARAWSASALLMAALGAAPVVAAEPSRITVDAQLVPVAAAHSADRRFALRADLVPDDRPQRGGAFAVRATFAPPAKAATAVCTALPDTLFANGFETP